MYENAVIESLETGKNVNADEKQLSKYYTDNLNNIVMNLKDNEFAVPTVICGITGKECEYGGHCSTCVVALKTITETSQEMEETETDLIHLKRVSDKKNGIDYLSTPSGRVRRYEKKSHLMVHLGLDAGDLIETSPEDILSILKTHSSVFYLIFSRILETSKKAYIAKKFLVFERQGGSVIVFNTV